MNKNLHRVLVVDDEPDILELLSYNLVKEGFEVATAANGQIALSIALTFKPELIILDMMMPLLDGIETGRAFRELPEFKNCFILYLTARSEEHAEIEAFEAGADDYITKPIKPKALMSRINAFFRKEADKIVKSDSLTVGGLLINRQQYNVTKLDNSVVVLPKKEFEVLFFLAQHPNKVFNREELLHKVWGDDIIVIERTVDVHIRKIREKIGENFIRTIKSVGYMFSDE